MTRVWCYYVPALALIFRTKFGPRFKISKHRCTNETLSPLFLCGIPELPLHLVVRPVEDPALRAAAAAAPVIFVSAVAAVCMIDT